MEKPLFKCHIYIHTKTMQPPVIIVGVTASVFFKLLYSHFLNLKNTDAVTLPPTLQCGPCDQKCFISVALDLKMLEAPVLIHSAIKVMIMSPGE